LHVESPSFTIDPNLNKLKQDVIAAIRAQTSDINKAVLQSNYDYDESRGRLSPSAVRNNKSTEVFRVILSQTQTEMTHQENIQLVHECIGAHISQVLRRFSARLKAEFGS
jgi:hypothetical protein